MNDQTMTYDNQTHKYVLTSQYVYNNGIDLDARLNTTGDSNPSTAKTRFLKFVSNHTYQFIYQFNPRYKMYTERELALNEDLRPIIREVMLNEVSFILDNGIFWNTAGVKKEIYDHLRISEESYIALLGAYCNDGQCLLYTGTRFYPKNINFYEGY